MSDFTTFLADAIEAAYADGSWLALYTDADTEAAFTGYGRQQLAVTSGANTGAVSVTNGEAEDVTITHAALWDAETVGNQLTTAKALAAPVVVAPGDTIEFAVAAITFAS